MKKQLLSLFAMASMLFTTSCSEDAVISQSTGNEVKVTFTTELRNDVKSRTVGNDVDGVNNLHFAVYQNGKNLSGLNQTLSESHFTDATKVGNDGVTYEIKKATIEVVLVKGQTYSFAFWADNAGYENNGAYKFDPSTSEVSIDYSKLKANQRYSDAFFGNVVDYTVTGSFEMDVTLKRPFAQVNFLTTNYDLDQATIAEFIKADGEYTSSIAITGAANTLKVLDGSVSGTQTAEFAVNSCIDNDWTNIKGSDGNYIYYDESLGKFQTTGNIEHAEDFTYLATAYFLPIQATAETQITATMTFNGETSQPVVLTADQIKAQRNFRTNIYGNLLTSNGQFNVTVDPEIGGNHNTEVEDPMNKVVYVQDATDLQSALENPNVGKVILTEDFTLDNSLVFGAPVGRAVSTDLAGRDFVIDGNGKTLRVNGIKDGKDFRLIDFTAATNGANLTLKNLTIENNVSWIERIINYNTYGILTLDNVTIKNAKGCSNNYAINLPASSDNATVVIKDSEIWAGANALNIWGEKVIANITDSKLYVIDSNPVEGYSVVSLNNQGENAAHNSIINVEGGEVKVVYEGEGETNPSSAFRDATNGSTINISENTVVVGEIKIPVANVIYEGYNEFYSFTTLQAAIDKVQADNNGKIQLIKDLVINETITVANDDFPVVLNLNGHNIVGTDNNTSGNFYLIDNRGTLTIEGTGKMTLKAETNREWNSSSVVVANNPGGVLIINSGVEIEHLGGTDMAYGVDNLTNGKGTSAKTTIDGATIKSTYRAVRQFLNGIEATNELHVKSGIIEGANKSIWMQDPSKNANTGNLSVDANAQLKGDVYLTVTEGSKEWPVEVSIAAKALVEGSEVLTSNVPEGYEVVLNNGNYVVKKVVTRNAATLQELESALGDAGAAGAGYSTIYITADIDMTNSSWTPIKIDGYNGADIVTVEGNGHTIKGLTAGLFAGGFAGGSGIVIKNLTIEDSQIAANNDLGYGAFVGCADSMDEITLINCHLKNSSIITPNNGADESRIGGLIGWTAGYNNQNDGPVDSYIKVQGCSVTGCTLKGAGSIGGIVGHAGANAATFTTIENCTVSDNTFTSTDTGSWRVGVVVGTANNGQCVINNITSSNNVLEQTDKTAPTGQSNLYGRFVPAGTGTLTIDGKTIN